MPELEDIKKNTGTAVPTEVSAEQVNPVQQPNININKTDVQDVATGTQPAQQNMQQPTQPTATTQIQQGTSISAPVAQQPDTTVQSAQTNQTAQNIEKPTEVRDLNDLRYSDSLLNELVQGYPIYGNGMAVDSARARYNQYNALNGMTYQQIGDAILTGEIAQNGTSMQDLKKYNPGLYDQAINYLINQKDVDTLNQLGQNLYDNYNGVENNSNYLKQIIQQENDTTKSIITTYSDDIIDFIKSYSTNATALMGLASNMLNSPEIQQYKNNILELEGKIANINTDIAYVGDEARNMLGSSAPESLVSAYISQQTKQLQRQLMTYQNSLLVEQGKLDNAVDNVKTQLDYYAKGMDMGIDALKALMGGGSSSSSSSSTSKKSSTTNNTTDTGTETVEDTSRYDTDSFDKLKNAILNGTFNWGFAKKDMSQYGINSSNENEILKLLAESITDAELLSIKDKVSAENYQKLLKHVLRNSSEKIIDLFKTNKDNYVGIANWLEKYGIKESDGKTLLNKAGLTTSEYNKVANMLGWTVQKDTTSNQNTEEVAKQLEGTDFVTPSKVSTTYVKTMNTKSQGSKTVNKSAKKGYDALARGTFNPSDKTVYGFAKGDTLGQIASSIGGVANNGEEISKLLKNADKLSFSTEDTAESFYENLISGYVESNWDTWTRSIREIGNNAKNLKLYIAGIARGTGIAGDIKELLKGAGISSSTIKEVLS